MMREFRSEIDPHEWRFIDGREVVVINEVNGSFLSRLYRNASQVVGTPQTDAFAGELQALPSFATHGTFEEAREWARTKTGGGA